MFSQWRWGNSAYATWGEGGEPNSSIEHMPSWFAQERLKRETRRSKREINFLGVLHLDLRPDNTLWNAELTRALIIDFSIVLN